MTKIKKYIILVVALSFVLQVQAQHKSEITIPLGAGIAPLKYQLNDGQSKFGFGEELGIAYSYYFSKMLGISLGMEVALFGSSAKINNISYEQQIETPLGLSGQFFLQTEYEGLEEKQSAVFLQIPVLLQLQFPVSQSSFLFLGAGIKVGFPVSSKWTQNATSLTTTGYSDYTDQYYTEIPKHGFSTRIDFYSSGKMELKSPVLFALEGGFKFAISKTTQLHTGIFLDYGLNNIHKASTNMPLMEYDNDSPTNYNYRSILTTNHYSASKGIKPFAVGIKIKMGMGFGGETANKSEKPKKPTIPREQKTEPIGG